jgi:tripartite-type tricarboxylate transporter receptor subunit TctC
LHFSLTSRQPLGKLAATLTILEEFPMQEYQDLKNLVAEIEADVQKAIGGNKAAGTRVRKQMQKIKQAAQLVRNRILEVRTTE